MAALTSEQVAKDLVGNYYLHLNRLNSPEYVHKFYKESSTLSRLASDGVVKHWTISEAINDHVLSYPDRVDFVRYSVDAQLSIGLGVHVFVNGCISLVNKTKRNFTQSFVLAPMNKPKAFIILNDVLRFHDQEETFRTSVKVIDSTADDINLDPADIASKEVVQEVPKEVPQGATPADDPNLEPADIASKEVDLEPAALASKEVAQEVPQGATLADDPNLEPADIASEVVVVGKESSSLQKSFVAMVNALKENNAPFKAARKPRRS